MKFINKNNFLPVIILVILIIIPYQAQSNSKKKGGPLPAANVEKLPRFLKLLAYSSKNIAEGDFETAVEILKEAEKIHPDDPMLLEYFGLAYDGYRDPEKAFYYFLRAGNEYYKMNNIEKSWKMIGWLNTFNSKSKAISQLEKKVRKKQLELNKKRKLEKK